MMTKKGISPLIATVLLIGFTIVLAALVMQWGGGLFEKIKGETSISSEVNLICSSGLSNLAVTSAKYDGTNLKVTVDNSNEQEIAGLLFRIHTVGGDVSSKSTKISDETTPTEDAAALKAFGVQTYTITQTLTANPDDATTYGEVGVMAIVTATDGSSHTCTNEKLVTITTSTV